MLGYWMLKYCSLDRHMGIWGDLPNKHCYYYMCSIEVNKGTAAEDSCPRLPWPSYPAECWVGQSSGITVEAISDLLSLVSLDLEKPGTVYVVDDVASSQYLLVPFKRRKDGALEVPGQPASGPQQVLPGPSHRLAPLRATWLLPSWPARRGPRIYELSRAWSSVLLCQSVQFFVKNFKLSSSNRVVWIVYLDPEWPACHHFNLWILFPPSFFSLFLLHFTFSPLFLFLALYFNLMIFKKLGWIFGTHS